MNGANVPPGHQRNPFYPLDRLGGFLLLVLCLFIGSWVQWGDWPNPVNAEKLENIDLIVALGGGAMERPRQAAQLYWQGISRNILVTGDGDIIYDELVRLGIPKQDILHETAAHSTWENASFVGKMPAFQQAKRIVLVTTWFHGPRAQAVFERQFPQKTFLISAEPATYPINQWVTEYRRRERYATFYYKLFYGVEHVGK